MNSYPRLLIFFLIAAGIIYLLENLLPSGKGGSLLFNLLFWVAIVEGSVAVVAAGELTNAKWIKPYRKELLSVYPLLLLLALMFVIFIPRLENYPWVDKPGIWLNKNLFIIRSILMLLLAFWGARKLAVETLSNSAKKNFYAVIYLFIFVTAQTSVAFDWVMSLEHPWFSTLFGGYFFIESFYSGLALGGILTFAYRKYFLDSFQDGFETARRDLATLLFAFATFWASQFYTQHLVIWYGNIPEEVSLIVNRISHSPMREFSYSIIVLLFIIPFVVFISRKMKANYHVFLTISIIVWLGLSIERLVLITPKLPANPFILVIEFVLIGGLFVYMIKNRHNWMPAA